MGRPKCPVCGSKDWRNDISTGLKICSEGHVQSYRRETTATGNLGPHAVKKRAQRSERNRNKKEQYNASLYHGQRARYLYVQCLQILLRQQIQALVKCFGVPDRFEATCRDVWALHLSLLPNPPSPETSSLDSQEQTQESQNVIGEPPGASQELPASSGAESGSDDDPDDQQLRDLMEEASDSTSEEEKEGMDLKETGNPVVRSRSKRKQHISFDTPVANIAVLLLSCWLIRFPIICMDLVRLIEGGDLPYLEPLRLMPVTVLNHINKQLRDTLVPRWAPTPALIYQYTSRLARKIHDNYSVRVPELNTAPILWRAVRLFNAPATLYQQSRRLADVLSISTTLECSMSKPPPQKGKTRPKYQRNDSDPAELSLMAVVILALKQAYGYDDIGRSSSIGDISGQALAGLQQHLSVLNHRSNMTKSSFDLTLARFHLKDSMAWDAAVMDKYLEHCEQDLLHSSGQQHYFSPNPQFNATEYPEKTPTPLSRYYVASPIQTGEHHVIYDGQDICGELPPMLKLVMETGANWLGMDVEDIASALETLERRLARWWGEERRRAAHTGAV